MARTDVTAKTGESELIVKKKIPLWEAIKSVSTVTGAGLIIAVIVSCIVNSWRARGLRSYDPQAIATVMDGGASAILLTASVGVISFINATEHNKKLDSFTKRLDEEKATNSAGSDTIGRSI